MYLNVMLGLIFVALVAICAAIWRLILIVSENLMSQNNIDSKIDDLQKMMERKGKVTDPFVAANKTHTVGASSQHIIIRKTPDQIRNENYQKIKEDGASYGSN